MKVFISSVITGFEAEREAVRQAILSLGYEPVRAEDFGASSSSPRVACLSGVRASDLVILVVGERYGYIQASGISATHEEFREAAGTKEIIAFIKNTRNREPEQERFLEEVQDWQSGLFTLQFNDAAELQRLVVRHLHQRGLDEARGRPDDEDMANRARLLLHPEERSWNGQQPTLQIALAVGPHQNILRPSELGSQELEDFVYTKVMMGSDPLFDRREGTDASVEGDAFVCSQGGSSISIHADGGLLVALPIRSDGHMSAIIEEDVQSAIGRTFALMDAILAKIDPTEKVRYVASVVMLSNADHCGWRTAEEHRRNPNSMTISGMYRSERAAVQLRPAANPRAVLRTRRQEMAEDLTVLLKRQMRA